MHKDKGGKCLPKVDVQAHGSKKLPTKPLNGPDKAKNPAFRTGKSG